MWHSLYQTTISVTKRSYMRAALFLCMIPWLLAGIIAGETAQAETGQKQSCPGRFFSYGCSIEEGEYRGFKIGESSETVFDGLCAGERVKRFRYIMIETEIDILPEEILEKHKPLLEKFAKEDFPDGSASFFAHDRDEFCALADIKPYIGQIAIRQENPFGPAVIFLKFKETVLSSIYLAGHTIDL